MFEPLIDHIPFIKYSIADMKTYSKYLVQLEHYVYGKTSVLFHLNTTVENRKCNSIFF
jgi:hypothetical protein